MANRLYEERLARIQKAVALEPVDKVPLAPCANAYWARAQGITLKEYFSSPEKTCTTNLNAHLELGGVDATQNEIFNPYLLSGQWLNKVAVPGKELGDDDMWQMLEKENVTQEDYYKILEIGFEPWLTDFLKEKCNDPEGKLVEWGFYDYLGTAKKRFMDAGIPCIADFLLITPFEFLCGGRSLEAFFVEDLMDEPELVEKVFEKIMEYTIPKYRAMMEAMHPIGVWVGGWRTAPEMLNDELWERFVWPYFKAYAELCIECDVIPLFHLDSCWDRKLERFREFPAKKCIMGLDSKTDIRLAKKTVGDMMCILGDVPPALTAYGTPKEIMDYVTKLLDDIGTEGIIISSGCDIPSDAKKENILAMGEATNNYLINKRK